MNTKKKKKTHERNRKAKNTSAEIEEKWIHSTKDC